MFALVVFVRSSATHLPCCEAWQLRLEELWSWRPVDQPRLGSWAWLTTLILWPSPSMRGCNPNEAKSWKLACASWSSLLKHQDRWISWSFQGYTVIPRPPAGPGSIPLPRGLRAGTGFSFSPSSASLSSSLHFHLRWDHCYHHCR